MGLAEGRPNTVHSLQYIQLEQNHHHVVNALINYMFDTWNSSVYVRINMQARNAGHLLVAYTYVKGKAEETAPLPLGWGSQPGNAIIT